MKGRVYGSSSTLRSSGFEGGSPSLLTTIHSRLCFGTQRALLNEGYCRRGERCTYIELDRDGSLRNRHAVMIGNGNLQ